MPVAIKPSASFASSIHWVFYMSFDEPDFYNATVLTKATQENFLQTSHWESHIGTMNFHKINYVWQIYPLSKHNKIQIAAILLFHHFKHFW